MLAHFVFDAVPKRHQKQLGASRRANFMAGMKSLSPEMSTITFTCCTNSPNRSAKKG
jgi:hypothetical protein